MCWLYTYCNSAVSHLSHSRVRPPPCKRLGSWWESCRLHTWNTEHGRSSSEHAWFPDEMKKRVVIFIFSLTDVQWRLHIFLHRGVEEWEVLFKYKMSFPCVCFDFAKAIKPLLPLWSSFCILHSWEHIGYRGTWYSRQTPSPRRSLLRPGPPYTVNTWTPPGAKNAQALPGTDPWNTHTHDWNLLHTGRKQGKPQYIHT